MFPLLLIRDRHLHAFDEIAESLLVQRLTATLRELHGERVVAVAGSSQTIERLDASSLQKLVRNAVARAKSHGLTLESSLASFVILMFEIAPNFDEHPVFKKYMNDPSVEPDDRIDRMLDQTTDLDWDEARSRYDFGAWGMSSVQNRAVETDDGR